MESIAAPRKTISGKSFTIAFVLLLIVGLILGFSLVLRFQAIMEGLDSVRSLWPNAAVALEEPLLAVDRLADAHPEKAVSQQWQEARKEYLSSSTFDTQSSSIPKLLELAHQLATDFQPPRNEERMARFLAADKELDALRTDTLGRMTMTFLRLKIPDSIHRALD